MEYRKSVMNIFNFFGCYFYGDNLLVTGILNPLFSDKFSNTGIMGWSNIYLEKIQVRI